MAKILVSGVAVLDFVFYMQDFPNTGEKYRADGAAIVGGGGAANAAVAIVKQGGSAVLAARLGDDQVADLIEDELRHQKVDISLVHRAQNARSSYSSIFIDNEGERQIMNFRGENLPQHPDWFDTVPTVSAVLTDNRWYEGCAKALEIARKQDVPGVVDAETPIELESIKQATHIAFSRQGLEAMTWEKDLHEGLRKASSILSGFLCVTDGAMGTFALKNTKVEHIPAPKVTAVDTLGAGDVWHGAFTLCLANGLDEFGAIEYANWVAAQKCMKKGGRETWPTASQTQKFIKEYTQ